MRVLINAIRLSSGGGLRVGLNLLKSFDQLNTDVRFQFLCPKENYQNTSLERVEKIYLPQNYTGILKWSSAQKWVKEQIKSINPSLVFNLCNTPIKTKKNQLLLLHWPYAAFDEDYIWKEMPWNDYLKRSLRLYLIKKNYEYVDHLTVQTDSMRTRSENKFLGSKEVTVIPSSFDLELKDWDNRKSQDGSKKNFLYVSKFNFHKNHKILLEVANLIKDKELNFVIQITIDEKKKECRKFLKEISRQDLNEQIINLGKIPQSKIDEYYEQAYASLNPSVMESFGLTYLEAAAKNKLVLASNLDFVKELLGDNAIYFDPFNAESILQAMRRSTDKEVYKEKVLKARKIIKEWPSWYDISKRYLKLFKKISTN